MYLSFVLPDNACNPDVLQNLSALILREDHPVYLPYNFSEFHFQSEHFSVSESLHHLHEENPILLQWIHHRPVSLHLMPLFFRAFHRILMILWQLPWIPDCDHMPHGTKDLQIHLPQRLASDHPGMVLHVKLLLPPAPLLLPLLPHQSDYNTHVPSLLQVHNIHSAHLFRSAHMQKYTAASLHGCPAHTHLLYSQSEPSVPYLSVLPSF